MQSPLLQRQSSQRPWTIASGVLLLIGVTVSAHLYWIAQNVVLIGRDASGHLERTAQIATLLTNITPQTLFAALTYHDYRPPALYLAAQPFYGLLGHSMDSAQWTNVFFMAVILGLTYALAVRIVSPIIALLAVSITAFLPMLMAMSRLYYMENFLTAVILFNLLALVRSENFQRRGWSLWWGVSLGLALLVKWTAPIYIILPTLFVLRAELRILFTQMLAHHKAKIARVVGQSPGVKGFLRTTIGAKGHVIEARQKVDAGQIPKARQREPQQNGGEQIAQHRTRLEKGEQTEG